MKHHEEFGPGGERHQQTLRVYFSGIYSNVRELLIGHIAKLNTNRYRKTYDGAIKAKIDRLTTELAALPERWSFVERKQRP